MFQEISAVAGSSVFGVSSVDEAELSSEPFAEVSIRRSSSKSVVNSSLVCSCGSQPLPSDLCGVGTISMRPSVGSLLPVVVHIHLML